MYQSRMNPNYMSVPTTEHLMNPGLNPALLPDIMDNGGYHMPESPSEDLDKNDRSRATTTDRTWLMLLVLTLLWLLMMLLGNVFVGSPGSLSHPRNYQGLACGWDSGVTSLPKLYFPLNPTTGKTLELYPERGMCLSKCPTSKDVLVKAYVTIPESALLKDKKEEAWLSVLHPIRSPVYATRAASNHLCVPEHPVLVRQFQHIMNAREHTLVRLLASGLHQTLPFILGLGLLAGLASIIVLRITNPIPGAGLTFLLTTTIATSFIMGLKCVSRGVRAPLNDSVGIAEDQRGLVVVGSILMLFAVGLIFRTASYRVPLSETSQLWRAKFDCQKQLGTDMNVYHLLQLLQALIAVIGIVSVMFIGSETRVHSTPAVASIDPNGGIEISTLERFEYTPFSITWRCFLVMAATVWMMETVLSIAKFVATYTTLMRVYRRPPGSTGAELSDDKPFHGLVFALEHYLGTLAYLSIFRCISRPLRTFFMLNAGTRFDTHDRMTQDASIQHKSMTETIVDRLHNGIFCEMILSTENLTACVKTSSNRMNGTNFDMIASTIGVPALMTWAHGMCVWIGVFYLSTSFLHSLQDSGSFYGGFPELTAACIATILTYVTTILWSVGEVQTDALLYGALWDYDTVAAAHPHHTGEFPQPFLCPAPVLGTLKAIHQKRTVSSSETEPSSNYMEGTAIPCRQ